MKTNTTSPGGPIPARLRLLPSGFLLVLVASLLLLPTRSRCGPLDSVDQLIVSVAPGWNSSSGKLQRFERAGREWKPVGPAVAVLYGRNGLVWGSGVLGSDEPGPHKVEKDKRAPAGVFKIGKIYTYDAQLPKGASYPYRTVSKSDAWVDDPAHPQYNQHVVIEDPKNPPPWFEKQKMRHGDFAYRWLVEIRHNSDPPVAGAGSAIFFHIRRGPQRPSAGCTTMAEVDCSGQSWNSSDSVMPMRSAPSSASRSSWSARFGHAG